MTEYLQVKKRSIWHLISMIAGCVCMLGSFSANAQFSGDFDQSNWTFQTDISQGSVNLSGMPDVLELTGGNVDEEGDTDYTIIVPQSGELKFSWVFFSTDVDGASFDPGGFVLNDAFTELVDTDGPPSQSGTMSVTVTAGDEFGFRVYTSDGALGAGILTISNFSPYRNTAPTIDPLVDLYLPVNHGVENVSLAGITSGIAEPTQTITVTATSSDVNIIAAPSITYTSPDETGSLSFSTNTDIVGEATITITVSDDGGVANGGVDTFVTSFKVVVSGNFQPQINELNPVVLPINSGEKMVALSGINSGKNTQEMQSLTLSATSSDQSIVADGNISIDYTTPNATGILSFTPEADVLGQTTITVTVMDDGGTDNGGINEKSVDFLVTLKANNSPSLDDISDLMLDVNNPLVTVNLSGIEDGDFNTQILSVTATSGNTDLIPDPTVTYTSPDNTGSLSFTPVMDASGEATITVIVQDDGGTAGGGINMIEKTFMVTVSGNFPPTIEELEPLVLPIDAPIQNINLNGITAGNGASQVLTVTAMSDNTDLIPTVDVTYTSPNNDGSISFQPTAAASGVAQITVMVQDDGGTDNGGVNITSTTFQVSVAGNLPPEIDMVNDITIDKNSGAQNISLFDIAAGSGETQEITVTATSNNTDLVDNVSVTYTSPDTEGSLQFTPLADQIGMTTITIQVSDDGGTENDGIDTITETFKVQVNNFITYSGTLDESNVFNRPDDGTPPGTTIGDDFYYHVQPFVVDTDEEYRLTTSSANFNTAMTLYQDSFDPSNPLVNAIASNDDEDSIFPLIIADLVTNKQYILVTTSSIDMENGNFTNKISGLGEASLGALPTLAFIDGIAIDEDGSQEVSFSGVTDGLGNLNGVTVTANGENQDIIDNITVTYDDMTGTGSFTLSPTANANGITEISVTVTNGDGGEFTRTFNLIVNPINDNPNFVLDEPMLTLNQGGDDTTINVTPDAVPTDEAGQTVTYSIDPTTSDLATIAIDASTGAISISGVSVSAVGSQAFTITANDGQSENNTASQTFTFVLNGIPTDITISNNSLDEDIAVGATVGDLSTTDQDAGDTFTYSLVSGTGDDNNTNFDIDGNALITAMTFDVAEETALSVRVRTTDANGATFEKAIELSVADVTGLEDLKLARNTTLSPNPTKGNFALSIEDPEATSFDLKIIDLSGKIIHERLIDTHQQNVKVAIDLNGVKKGMYLIKLVTNDGRLVTKRLVKY